MVCFQAVPQVKRTESPVRTPCQSPLVVDRGFLVFRDIEVSFHGHSKSQIARSEDVKMAHSKHGKHVDTPRTNASNLEENLPELRPRRIEPLLEVKFIWASKFDQFNQGTGLRPTETCRSKGVKGSRCDGVCGNHTSQRPFHTLVNLGCRLDTQLLS